MDSFNVFILLAALQIVFSYSVRSLSNSSSFYKKWKPSSVSGPYYTTDRENIPINQQPLSNTQTWDMFQDYAQNRDKSTRTMSQEDLLKIYNTSGLITTLKRGPPGPRGPPGVSPSLDDVLKAIGSIINELSQQRAAELVRKNCLDEKCVISDESLRKTPYFMLDDVRPFTLTHGFLCKVRKNVLLTARTMEELSNYEMPLEGSFLRGTGFDMRTGRFQTLFTAVYSVVANIQFKVKPADLKKVGKRDHIVAYICLDSKCQFNSAIYFVSPLGSSKYFTAHISSIMRIQKGQYISVHVQNNSPISVMVLKHSDFAASLLGA